METETKTLFQHLHSDLLEYQTRFADVSTKGASLNLLALGWMLTSEPARTFIATNTSGRSAAITGIVIMEAAYLFLAIRMAHVMQRLARQMDALDYLPRSYYDFRALPPRIIATTATIAIAPAGIAIAFMLLIAK
ncbi:MAG TPA: hypothetical protein VNN08_24155 [Thermoanaerobaculia bacterium]|nr:hypothetical protein [Thermoanaerobaculia bacterium]